MRSATRAEVTESFPRHWRPTKITRPGLEPGISGSGSRCLVPEASGLSAALFQAEATAKAKASKFANRVELQICARTAAQLTRPLRRRFEKPEPLRAEPNGFLVHHLKHSVTLS